MNKNPYLEELVDTRFYISKQDNYNWEDVGEEQYLNIGSATKQDLHLEKDEKKNFKTDISYL